MDNNSRIFQLFFDEYGIDPLKDEKFWAISDITVYQLHTVTQQEAARPDLIALDLYGTEKLWWCLMQYNGIALFSDFTAGAIIKVPDPSELRFVLTNLLESNISENTTVGATVKI